MKFFIGDIIESEFGSGKVVAITDQWIVHEIDGGKSEVAIARGEQPYWVTAEPGHTGTKYSFAETD